VREGASSRWGLSNALAVTVASSCLLLVLADPMGSGLVAPTGLDVTVYQSPTMLVGTEWDAEVVEYA